jgi:hypothetical protein
VKPAVTGTGPTFWLTDAMVQLVAPEVPVVALQLWVVAPDPMVKVTTRPTMPEPAAEARTPDTETAWPFTVVAEPV